MSKRLIPPFPSLLLLMAFAGRGGLWPCAGADSNLDLVRQLNQAFIEVAEKASPSVVVITVTQKPPTFMEDHNGAGDGSAEPTTREFLRRFHEQFEDIAPEKNQGSGIIIRKDGYILTNRHVVDGADRIEVRLLDGRTFNATVRGLDPASDLAVIKIDADDLPVARLADSSRVRVGEFAIAIGAPFNYDYSVTFGHVSAKGRSNVVPVLEGGGGMDQDFIQTDATINPGNSGGPLLNIDGEVIGINTLIRGLHTGISFAVPSNLAREIADKLIAEGKFTRAWLGIGIRAVRDYPEFRELVKGISDGVVVQTILPDGPAAKSDLQPADVITTVEGRPVSTTQQLRKEVRDKPPGQAVTLEVFRAGKIIPVKIRPDEYLDSIAATTVGAKKRPETPPAGLGIQIEPLVRESTAPSASKPAAGVVVASVDRDSLAARKGIKPGDLITAINQHPIATAAQFSNAVAAADLKVGILLGLSSGGMASFEILKEGGQ